MNDWDDYHLILALTRCGTLRGAAEQLNVNHSTVSRRLAALNRKFGFAVFERTVSGYRICEQARVLMSAAEDMEALILSAKRQVKLSEQGLTGDISLSIPYAIGQYLLLDDLFQFTQQYPNINLQIDSSYQFANLDRSEADVVIRGCNSPPEHLVGHRLYPLYLCLYANAKLLKETPRSKWRWIVPPYEGEPPAWIAKTPYADVPIALAIDDVTMRHHAAIAGKGLYRGACYMADPEPTLIRLPQAKPTPAYDLWVLTHPDLKDVPRIKTLVAFLYRAMQAKRALVLGTA